MLTWYTSVIMNEISIMSDPVPITLTFFINKCLNTNLFFNIVSVIFQRSLDIEPQQCKCEIKSVNYQTAVNKTMRQIFWEYWVQWIGRSTAKLWSDHR